MCAGLLRDRRRTLRLHSDSGRDERLNQRGPENLAWSAPLRRTSTGGVHNIAASDSKFVRSWKMEVLSYSIVRELHQQAVERSSWLSDQGGGRQDACLILAYRFPDFGKVQIRHSKMTSNCPVCNELQSDSSF